MKRSVTIEFKVLSVSLDPKSQLIELALRNMSLPPDIADVAKPRNIFDNISAMGQQMMQTAMKSIPFFPSERDTVLVVTLDDYTKLGKPRPGETVTFTAACKDE